MRVPTGLLADLVLLDATPLEHIKNTQTVWRVIKGGWVFDPEVLAVPSGPPFLLWRRASLIT